MEWRRREKLNERKGEQGVELKREELSQFECKLCGDQHYHTKRKLQLLELPGYEFTDPCPPSVRSVGFLKNLILKLD